MKAIWMKCPDCKGTKEVVCFDKADEDRVAWRKPCTRCNENGEIDIAGNWDCRMKDGKIEYFKIEVEGDGDNC